MRRLLLAAAAALALAAPAAAATPGVTRTQILLGGTGPLTGAESASAFVGAARLGWSPREYVSSVSIDPAVMKIVQLNAGAQAGVGAISTAFLHDPTNPAQRRAPGVALYRQIMKRYLPAEDPGAVAHLDGIAAAYAMVDALRHAGRNPTRASLLAAATHLHEANPFLLPGIGVSTSPGDYYPIRETYLVRYGDGHWNVLGKPLATG